MTIFYGLIQIDTSVLVNQKGHKVCVNTGYSLEDLPGAMVYRNGRRERLKEIQAISTT